MNVVRDCPEARWLPARHRFALARMIAFFCANRPSSPPKGVDRLLLAIDRDQSAVENYTVTIWLLLTATLYVASLLPLTPGIAIVVATPIAAVALQGSFILHALLWNLISGARIRNNVKRNSVFLMTAMILASAYFATLRSPVRYVAWFFLGVLALNAVAAMIMFLLRNSVRELERKCGI